MMNKNADEHVFFWQIENFGEIYTSQFFFETPSIVAESLDMSKWRLTSRQGAQSLAVMLIRCSEDDGPKLLILDIEFFLIDRGGRERFNQIRTGVCFQRGLSVDLAEFLQLETLTMRRDELLRDDVLTLQCRACKSRRTLLLATMSIIHTQILVEKSSFVWTIRDSKNKPVKRTVRIESDSFKNILLLQCEMVNRKGNNESMIRLTLQTSVPPNSFLQVAAKVIVLSSRGKPLVEVESSYFSESKTEVSWPLPNLYLSNTWRRPEECNRVDLSCEFKISSGSSDPHRNTSCQVRQTSAVADVLELDDCSLESDLRSVFEKTARTVSMDDSVSNADIMLRASNSNNTFWAHKMILSARSSVFCEILNDFDFQKKRWLQQTLCNTPISKCNVTVTKERITVRMCQGLDYAEISDITSETLSQVLQCMYTDSVNLCTVENAKKLLHASSYLKFEVLERKSRDYVRLMCDSLNVKQQPSTTTA